MKDPLMNRMLLSESEDAVLAVMRIQLAEAHLLALTILIRDAWYASWENNTDLLAQWQRTKEYLEALQ